MIKLLIIIIKIKKMEEKLVEEGQLIFIKIYLKLWENKINNNYLNKINNFKKYLNNQ